MHSIASRTGSQIYAHKRNETEPELILRERHPSCLERECVLCTTIFTVNPRGMQACATLVFGLCTWSRTD